MRILLVEDDKLLAEGIRESIIGQGYTMDWLDNGESALDALSFEHFDTVILDLGLPECSGIDVLKKLRKKKNHVPVLILSAYSTISDRISGLDAGADDYLTKPFDLMELQARLRALVRRGSGNTTPVISYKGISLDPSTHKIKYQNKDVALGRREFALLKQLLEHEGQVLSKARLEQTLYGWSDDVSSNTIEVHIHYLRKKFYTDLIRTIRGVGYIVEKAA